MAARTRRFIGAAGFLVAALVATGCGGSSGGRGAGDATAATGGAPGDGSLASEPIVPGQLRPGYWAGDFIDLVTSGGQVVGVRLHDIICIEPNPQYPLIKQCTSDLAEGNFAVAGAPPPSVFDTTEGELAIATANIEVVKIPNGATGRDEWHLMGTAGEVEILDALFAPVDAAPEDFTEIHGIFRFTPAQCECQPLPDGTTPTCGCAKRQWQFVARWQEGPPAPPSEGEGEPITPDNPGGPYPDDATPEQVKALYRVNWYRQQLGVPLVKEIAPLNQMATDHCACFMQHGAEYDATGMSPHSEDPNWPPPCHGDLGARAEAAGVQGGVAEVMAFMGDPVGSVDGWVATLYHRLPLLDPGTKEIGYGMGSACDTINSTVGGSASTWEVAYPYDGQTDVDTCWNGAESPKPAPPPSGHYPSGPVITLQFGSAITFTINESSITNPYGQKIPHTLLVPNNDPNLAGSATVSLIPNKLKPGTTYTVRLAGTKVGEPWEKEWSFTTADVDRCQ